MRDGSGGGELENGSGVVGHELDVEALQGANADFVGGEIDIARNLDVESRALAEVPVTLVAKIGLILAEVRVGVVDGHDADPADRKPVQGRAIVPGGDVGSQVG